MLKDLQFGTRFLRITRRVPANTLASEISGDAHTSEDELAIEDDDPEALDAPMSSYEHMRVVQCDVVYSPPYQVPVLYLTFAESTTNKSIPLPSPDEVYKALVSNEFKSAMRDVGVMGALSMGEHPVTGVPAYFVHPCRTQEVLAPLLGSAKVDSSETSPQKAMKYLMLWFGVIGASVGLSVPIRVAKLFVDSRGDALESA